MITSKTSKKDKRRERLELTSMGKQFVFESMMKVKGLSAEYKKLVGEADLAIAVKVINHIIDYHKGHNASVDENGVVD